MPLVLEVDADELEGLALALELDVRAAEQAARVAANRAVRWARTQVARGLASRARLPQGVVMSRTRAASTRGTRPAKTWVGLNNVSVSRLEPVKTSVGMSAGGREFVGAFWMRGRKGGRSVMRRVGDARLPVEKVTVDVAAIGYALVEREAWPELQERFLGFYKAELARKLARM